MKYVGDVELMLGMFRMFAEGAAIGDDPYEFVCGILWHDRSTAVLKGVKPDMKLPFVAMRSAVADRMLEFDINEVLWIRKNRGRPRAVRMIATRRLRTGPAPAIIGEETDARNANAKFPSVDATARSRSHSSSHRCAPSPERKRWHSSPRLGAKTWFAAWAGGIWRDIMATMQLRAKDTPARRYRGKRSRWNKQGGYAGLRASGSGFKGARNES